MIVTDDEAIANGLSIWTDVSGCSEAVDYLYLAGFDCSSELDIPFLGVFIVSPFSLSPKLTCA